MNHSLIILHGLFLAMPKMRIFQSGYVHNEPRISIRGAKLEMLHIMGKTIKPDGMEENGKESAAAL